MTSSVDRVLELMRVIFGSKFKQYYTGDPEVIPTFNLPAIIVTQTKDDTTEGEMGEDDVSDEIRIKLVLNKADDYTGDKIDPLNLTDKKLRDLVGARGDDGRYLPGTVKGALRNDLLEGVTAVAPSMSIEYGINPRETLGSENNAAWTAEAWVTFAIEYSVNTYR